jgi:glycosyltransferase involved in cell wall biosynthesis
MSQPKVAIVTDWLTHKGGSERVVVSLHKTFPTATIFTSVYEPDTLLAEDFKDITVQTTWLQKLPRPIRKLHKLFPLMRVKAFRDLDLSDYDIIISSTGAEAKQVRKTRKDQVHICYCYTPIRYYWSHYDEYRKNPGLGKLNWIAKIAMPLMVPALRKADFNAAQDVDQFIAISTVIQERIKKYYKKDSIVIHPPVDISRFHKYSLAADKRQGYLAHGRQVPYKKVDLAIRACNALRLPLTVSGSGSEHEHLKSIAGNTVTFQTGLSDEAVAKLFGSVKGYIFPAEEDFGIVQVEALAAGTPVIAYASGGSKDIIENGKGGITFRHQNEISLINALKEAETSVFKSSDLQRISKRFAETLFAQKMKKIVSDNTK